MLVSHRHQFIYTKTHKTAGTSVEGYFERYCLPPDEEFHLQHFRPSYESEHGIVGSRGKLYRGENPKWWNHMPASQIRRQLGDKIWNTYFKFCVVRNPFEKVVSHFFWSMRQDGKPATELFSMSEHQLRERFENWLPNARLPDDRERFMIDGEICMDDFIRHENLHSDLERIGRKVGVNYHPDLMPSFKREYRPPMATVEALFTPRAKDIVEKFYEHDLQYFGYEFPGGNVIQTSKGSNVNAHSKSGFKTVKTVVNKEIQCSSGLNNEEVVQQVYQSILGREADAGGLEHYSRVLSEPGGVLKCMNAMIGSAEFANKIRAAKRKINFSKADLEQEKIVFLHIPKTGGTTLHHLLIQGRSDGEICPERFNGLHAFTAGELVAYRIFSGHFDHPSTELIPGRKAVITMFREPVARLVSLYHFQRSHRDEVIERDGLKLASLAHDHSMEEFFSLEVIRNHPSINNAMTRMLSERVHSWRWESGSQQSEALQSPNLDLAWKNLEGLRAFGLMERYEESVRVIFEKLGLPIPQEIPRKMVLDHIMQEDPGLQAIEKQPITPVVRELLEDLVNADKELYASASDRFVNMHINR